MHYGFLHRFSVACGICENVRSSDGVYPYINWTVLIILAHIIYLIEITKNSTTYIRNTPRMVTYLEPTLNSKN